jgi:hypothetical protein
MLKAIPLTLIPLIIFNLVGYVMGGDPWGAELFSITLISGATWIMALSDVMVFVAIVLLFLEIVRAARPGPSTIYNHIASTGVLVIYIVEFIVVSAAANSMFFILTTIALFDVVAGFTISIRASTRDIALGHSIDGPL